LEERRQEGGRKGKARESALKAKAGEERVRQGKNDRAKPEKGFQGILRKKRRQKGKGIL